MHISGQHLARRPSSAAVSEAVNGGKELTQGWFQVLLHFLQLGKSMPSVENTAEGLCIV